MHHRSCVRESWVATVFTRCQDQDHRSTCNWRCRPGDAAGTLYIYRIGSARLVHSAFIVASIKNHYILFISCETQTRNLNTRENSSRASLAASQVEPFSTIHAERHYWDNLSNLAPLLIIEGLTRRGGEALPSRFSVPRSTPNGHMLTA